MKLGFIGLGQMGKYCALNLLKNRGELHVNDIDPEAVAFLISHGAKKSDSNAELMSVCDIVFLCLPNGDTTQMEERRVGKECRSRWSPYH